MADLENNQNQHPNSRVFKGDTGVSISRPLGSKDFLDPEVYRQELGAVRKDLGDVKDQVKKLEEIRISNVEILGLFVALFTFISIEFQMAKNVDFGQFIVFSPFYAGLLAFFVFVLHITIHDKINWRTTIFIFLLILIFFAGGFLSKIFFFF